MKLVIATPLYPPDIGGPATYAKLLEEGLPPRGIEVEVVKFGDVRHLPKLRRHAAYHQLVNRALKDADAVLALDPVSVGLPACLAAWRAGKPFIVKIVGDYAWEQGKQRFGIADDLDAFIERKSVPLPVWFLRKVQTGVANSARSIIVPSEYLKRVIETWGVPSAKIAVIHNAVTAEEPGDLPPGVDVLPRPRVAVAGRLVPWKRVDGVIDAVAYMPDASLVVVGDGPLRASLEARAQEKLPGRHLFTGALSHAQVLAAVRAADVYVLNSSYEGLSHHLIEACALGKPIVATDVGGNGEVIADDENGLLIPSGDGALSAALSRLLSDAALAKRLGEGAKESAKRFSEGRMLERTAEFLKHV